MTAFQQILAVRILERLTPLDRRYPECFLKLLAERGCRAESDQFNDNFDGVRADLEQLLSPL